MREIGTRLASGVCDLVIINTFFVSLAAKSVGNTVVVSLLSYDIFHSSVQNY